LTIAITGETSMPLFTVRRDNDHIQSEEIRAYRALMVEKHLKMAPDKREPKPDGSIHLRTDPNCLCLWKNEGEAHEFCEELSERTRSAWRVEEVEDGDMQEDQSN
jgi:hypothetical protein